jgi:hypothetical protein
MAIELSHILAGIKGSDPLEAEGLRQVIWTALKYLVAPLAQPVARPILDLQTKGGFMSDPILCQLNVEGELLELGAYRFLVVPRVGEIIFVSVPGDKHDEIFRVVRVAHSALESREAGDYVKLVVSRELNLDAA